jgi:hypothetical protein
VVVGVGGEDKGGLGIVEFAGDGEHLRLGEHVRV